MILLNMIFQSFGFVSNNPVLKNITDFLVDEGNYEEEALLGEAFLACVCVYILFIRCSAVTSLFPVHCVLHQMAVKSK